MYILYVEDTLKLFHRHVFVIRHVDKTQQLFHVLLLAVDEYLVPMVENSNIYFQMGFELILQLLLRILQKKVLQFLK